VRVLLLGSGGREHALALSLAADPAVTALHCAPGNPGMAALAQLHPVDLADLDALAALAVEVAADLVVVGPEAPLVAGAADVIGAKGIPVFGPSKAAARIEGSKDFAKSVMVAAGVPTARSFTCETPEQVAAALDTFGAPYVVKDDALAAGKGVVVTDDRGAALAHAAGCGRVVVEEYLSGPEVSLFVVTDGVAALPLQPAQDFKRIGDGDEGPNTGGMGAYTPLPWAPADLTDRVLAEVVHPTLARMRELGTPFVGLLYVGLALTSEGPKVIEFNCRFGDPETQVVLRQLDTPLAGVLYAAATGALAGHPPLRWRDGATVGVVLASAGYPESARSGDVITGGDGPGVVHAGTAVGPAGQLVTSGGRVLCVTADGADLAAARQAAYARVRAVSFPGARYRTDIAALAAAGQVTVPTG
jgi:phosphoribosylamine--glycine ligase